MKRKNNISPEERLRMAQQLRLNCRNVTSEDKARAGRIGGTIAGRINGPINGRRNVENGHLARARTPEHQRAAGTVSGNLAADRGETQQLAHFRWHVVERRKPKKYCQYCDPKPVFGQ
jgi:hypothetical protein